MQYIQGGADFTTSLGVKGKTKKELKQTISEVPHNVYLYATSDMGPQFNGPADRLPEGTTFNVVGPDPYTKRTWYASVKVGPGGKLVVS